MAERGLGRFGATAVSALFFQGIGMMLSITWVYVVSRALGVAATGQVFVALAIVNTSVAVFSLGLTHAIPVASRELDDVALASNALVCIVAAGLLAALCLWLLPIAAIHADAFRYRGVVLLPAILPFYLLNILGTVTLRAVGRFRIANWCNIVVFGLFNLFLLVAWLGERVEITTSRVLFAFLVACVGGAAAVTVALMGAVGFSRRTLATVHLRRLSFFGGTIHVGNVLKEVMYRADLYLVSGLLGAIAAGYYGVVLRVVEAIGRFVDAIGLIAIPMIARGTEGQRERITYLSLAVSVPLMTLAAIGASLLAPWVITLLFGTSFLPATPLLRVGVLALVPLTIWKILANDVIARGMAAPYILSAAVGAATIVILNVALLRPVGLAIAPVVLNVAYLLPAVILAWVVVRRVGYRPSGVVIALRQLLARAVRPCRPA